MLAASTLAPSGALARAALPAVTALLRIGPVGRFAVDRLAAVRTGASPQPREHSWARARALWTDGETREVWLRAPEAMTFTARVAAEVIRRCIAGESRPGSFTPGAAFGPQLATSAGGEFLIDPQSAGGRED